MVSFLGDNLGDWFFRDIAETTVQLNEIGGHLAFLLVMACPYVLLT